MVNSHTVRLCLVAALCSVAIALSGCSGAKTASTTGSAAPETKSDPVPSVKLSDANPSPDGWSDPPTGAQPTNVAAPASATWKLKRDDDYQCEMTISVWSAFPPHSSGTLTHPADSKVTVSSESDFDPKTDIVIPIQLKVKNTTPNFDFENLVAMVSMRGLAMPKDTKKSYSKALDQIFFLDDGRNTDKLVASVVGADSLAGPGMSVTNADLSGLSSITWASLAPNALGIANGVVIFHDYFAPSTPSGSKEMLGYLALQPNLISWSTDAAGRERYVTLSGVVGGAK